MVAKVLLPAALLLAFVLLAVTSIVGTSVTSDEVAHLPAGYTYIQTGDFRLNAQHPPLLKALAAMPLAGLALKPIWEGDGWARGDDRIFGGDFLTHNSVPLERILFFGRLPMIAVGALLCLLTFWWARELWGDWPALWVLLCCAFCPNILAHASLVTTDAGLTCFTVGAVFALWRFGASGRLTYAAWCGVALGLALLAKYSGVLTGAIVGALLVSLWWHGRAASELARAGTLIAGIAALLVSIGYGFPNGLMNYYSGFQHINADFDLSQPSFLWGEHSTAGFWYYYLLAQWWKTPIPALILFGAALATIDVRGTAARRDWLFVLLPIGVFHLAAMFYRPNIGVRHILPVFPFVFLATGAVVQRALVAGWRSQLAIGVLAFWYLAGTLHARPHFLAYFNELAGGPDNGIDYLIDSNLEWGQDIHGLRDYIDRIQPAAVRAAVFSPLPLEEQGVVAAPIKLRDLVWPEEDVTYFVGPYHLQRRSFGGENPALRFRWLERYVPIDKIGWSIFVYRISTRRADQASEPTFYVPRAQWYEDARRQLADILTHTPDFAEARQLLARLHFERSAWLAEQGEHGAALEDARSAVRLAGDVAEYQAQVRRLSAVPPRRGGEGRGT